jgi:hypothetical protein
MKKNAIGDSTRNFNARLRKNAGMMTRQALGTTGGMNGAVGG